MLVIILHTLLYIKKEQKQTGKGKSANGTEERGTGQRMPPPSSPVPRLSSVPSAVLTVRTIASARPLTLTTSHQRPQGSASTVCHPARLVPVLFPPSGGEGRAASQPGRASPCRSPCRGKTASAPPRTSGGSVRIFHRPGRTDTQPG